MVSSIRSRGSTEIERRQEDKLHQARQPSGSVLSRQENSRNRDPGGRGTGRPGDRRTTTATKCGGGFNSRGSASSEKTFRLGSALGGADDFRPNNRTDSGGRSGRGRAGSRNDTGGAGRNRESAASFPTPKSPPLTPVPTAIVLATAAETKLAMVPLPPPRTPPEGVLPVNNNFAPGGDISPSQQPTLVTVTIKASTVTMDPSTIILLSTVLPDFVTTVPSTVTGAAPSATVSAGASNGSNAQTQNPNPRPQRQEQSGSMNGTTERILISVGSIGSFVIVCFLVWMVWRTMKKSKQQRQSSASSEDTSKRGPFAALYHKVLGRATHCKTRQLPSWQRFDDKDIPVAYLARSKSSPSTSTASTRNNTSYGDDGGEKPRQPPLAALPPLQTQMQPTTTRQMTASPAGMGASPTGAGTGSRGVGVAAPPEVNGNSPTDSVMDDAQIQRLQYALVGTGPGPFYSDAPMMPSRQGSSSFSPVNSDPSGMTMNSSPDGTWRSRMPDPFYNQSELARKPSDAYDPSKRQVNRLSTLSSISSGFGDGDIIVPDQLLRQTPANAQVSYVETQVQPGLQPMDNARTSTRTSWMSRYNRDTVYTESSEDFPPRFRSVSSWVNQQTSRVRRAGERVDEQVPPVPGMPMPGVHNMPPEPQLNMMMDDGQAPRAPESVLR